MLWCVVELFIVLCYHAKLGLRQRTQRLVVVRWVSRVGVTRGIRGEVSIWSVREEVGEVRCQTARCHLDGTMDLARLQLSQCCCKRYLVLDVSLVLNGLVWRLFVRK